MRADRPISRPRSGRERIGERAQGERYERRARILVSDAAFAQVRNAPLRREHGDGPHGTVLGCIGRRPCDTASIVLSPVLHSPRHANGLEGDR